MLPPSAQIGPFRYVISDDPQDWDDCGVTMDDQWGHTDHTLGVILLTNEAHPDLARTILLHEILHACAFTAGAVTDKRRPEEEWVTMAAPMLLDCLRQSPEVRAFLFEGLDGFDVTARPHAER